MDLPDEQPDRGLRLDNRLDRLAARLGEDGDPLDALVLLDESVPWAELEQLVLGVARRCVFVEEYRGKQIPAGKKSVMFRYWLGSDQGTLTAEQIESETARLIKRIGKTLGGEIRQAEAVQG